VRAGCGRLELSLLLWLESLLWLGCLPASVASGAASLLVAGAWALSHLALRGLCGVRLRMIDVSISDRLSRPANDALYVGFFAEAAIRAPALGAVAAAVGPAWACAAGALLCLRAASALALGWVRGTGGDGREGGNGASRDSDTGGMAAVVAAAFSLVVLGPLAGLCWCALFATWICAKCQAERIREPDDDPGAAAGGGGSSGGGAGAAAGGGGGGGGAGVAVGGGGGGGGGVAGGSGGAARWADGEGASVAELVFV
jgi:hypothetical protein